MAGKRVEEKLLRKLLDAMIDNKRIYSVVLSVGSGDGNFTWTGAAGEMQKEDRFFIASVTKMYVTAVVMQLMEQGRLSPDDAIAAYLPASICDRLHVLKGVDYSAELTIRHLISNTSGLPDYFFHKQENGRTVADNIVEGQDEAWPLDRTIDLVKNLKPNFRPGRKGKVAYSDTNYQLLGRILENIVGKRIGDIFKEYVFDPLELQHTYLYNDVRDESPARFYYKSTRLWVPNYMTSVGPEGGIVSTAEEVFIFSKAFFSGKLFPREKIGMLKQWNLLFPPPGLFYYGFGLEKLWIPWFISPFRPIREILGFWGQTGSFAFYNPQTDLHFCGTTNQINGAGHRAATNAMIKIIKAAL